MSKLTKGFAGSKREKVIFGTLAFVVLILVW